MSTEKIRVVLSDGAIDVVNIYSEFYSELADSTGTILVHHGKAKFPGKYIHDYSKIQFTIKNKLVEDIIKEKASEIFYNYNLNKIFVYHSLGVIYKNDPILFLAVEGKDRESAFIGVREMLEFIKSDELIELEECK